MFHFSVITAYEGSQIIDRRKTTNVDILSPLETMEYMEIDNLLYMAERERRKRKYVKKRNVLNILLTILLSCFR